MRLLTQSWTAADQHGLKPLQRLGQGGFTPHLVPCKTLIEIQSSILNFGNLGLAAGSAQMSSSCACAQEKNTVLADTLDGFHRGWSLGDDLGLSRKLDQ